MTLLRGMNYFQAASASWTTRSPSAAFPNVSLAPVRPRPGERSGSAASVYPLSTIVGAK